MNAEHNLIAELSDILGHNTKTAALFEEMAPAPKVVVEPAVEEEVVKVASVTDAHLADLIENPAFLAGVEEVFEKRAAELDVAMNEYVEKVAIYDPSGAKGVARNARQHANLIAERVQSSGPGTTGSARAAADAAEATREARISQLERAGRRTYRGGGKGKAAGGTLAAIGGAAKRHPILTGLGAAGGIGFLASR